MKVNLKIDGQEKEFIQKFVPGIMFRKTLEMQPKVSQRLTPELLDEFVQYAVDLFSKQFTIDQFYNGIDSRFMFDTIIGFINGVISGASEAVGADASDPN